MQKLTNLRHLREHAALTQAETAVRAGIAESTYRYIENLEVTPRPQTVRKVADALGVEPHELWESEVPKASAPSPETDSATARYAVSAEDLTRMFHNLARRGQRIAERSVREGASEELSREVADYYKEAITLRRVKGGRDIRGKDPEELAEAIEDYEEVEARIQSMIAQDLFASPAERAERLRFKEDKGGDYSEERGASTS